MVILALLIALSVGLNLWHIDWGLPSAERSALYPQSGAALLSDYQTPMDKQFYKTSAIVSFHPDEITLLKSFLHMHLSALDLNPHFYAYPSFCIYAVGIALEIGKVLNLVTPTDDNAYYFAHPDAAQAVFIAGRLVFVLLGALGVIALFWVARRLYGTRTAVIAATLLALTPEWLRESHFITVNVAQAAFMTLAVAASLKVVDSTRPMRWVILAGVATGFATGSKYHGILIMGVALLCLAERWRQERKQSNTPAFAYLRNRALVLGGVTVAAFLVTTPYAIFDRSAFVHDLLAEYTLKVVDTSSIIPVGPPQWAGLMIVSFGLPILILAALGIVLALRNITSLGTRIMIVWAVPFIAVLAITHIIYARYIVPVAPLIALLAALPLAALLGFALNNRAGLVRRGIPILLLLIAVPILLNTVVAESGLSQNPQMESATWLRAHLPQGSRILMFDTPSFDAPPIDNTYYHVQVNGEWQPNDFDAIIFTSVNRWIPDRYRPLRRTMLADKTATAQFEGFQVRQFTSRPPGTLALPDDMVPEDWKYTEYSVFILYQQKSIK